ncbi:MAG TPA: hypothetical protein VH969_10535 [Actinophytocola sp.]|uniref:hypothetical protein n=1 Tax=Actinophytocola sp. TaxID=1872138 RepID=UPI002F95CCD9
MRKIILVPLVATAAATIGVLGTVSSAAAEEHMPVPQSATVRVEGADGLSVDAKADKQTIDVIENDASAAVAAANVCGAGYTISTGAWRLPSTTTDYGSLYTWTNGKTSGPSYYDKPICAVFFNDTGVSRYMGVRLKSNYTADPAKEDFGTYSSYAGPVYQNRGYCGTAYAYMENSSGTVLVDSIHTVGACN